MMFRPEYPDDDPDGDAARGLIIGVFGSLAFFAIVGTIIYLFSYP